VSDADILARLAQAIEARKSAAAGESYVASLFSKGLDAMLKKVGEEATETVLAAKDGDAEHLVREVADLWFHTLVVLAYAQRGPADVLTELARREGVSGIKEKASRTGAEKPCGGG
jgi:phosphoribosyl-ATP pyrophosphohydrolase